jgi:arsenate reductase (glutaredoxin)
MNLTIYHNSSCSTSRKVLDYLQAHHEHIEIRNYIANPPSVEELTVVLKKMNANAEDILRKKDKVYLEKFKDKTLTNQEWIEAMVEHPTIIERPIIIGETKAWLPRPVDAFLEKGLD